MSSTKYKKKLLDIPFDKIYIGMRVSDLEKPVGTVVYTRANSNKENRNTQLVNHNKDYIVVDWDDGGIGVFSHNTIDYLYYCD